MRRRAFLADHLPDLELAQLADHPGAEEQPDGERRQARGGRPERDVARHVEDRPVRRQVVEVVQHQANSAFSRSTT